MLKRFFAFLCVLLPAIAMAAPTTIIGTVLEAETDHPLSSVAIQYESGRALGETNGNGRFELTADSRSAKLVFIKDGFDTLHVSLEDFADLLDIIVVMHPNVRNLGESTVIGGGVKVEWPEPSHISVEQLEDVSGMRFDIAELMTSIEGVSGQKDFSSALYYDGSRADEVGYHLGRLRIPNMRHLDIGFPGNLSVINSHMLKSIDIYDHYGEGPLGQGLATSVDYIPETLSGEDFEVDVSAGTTMREISIGGPSLFWDSFRFSFRYLDAEMLKNMGEKFFTEFRRNSEGESSGKTSDSFDVTSYDMFAQLAGHDSLDNRWMLNGVYSNDEYIIRQDTVVTADSTNSVDIIRGHRMYGVLGFEYQSRFGTSFHGGVVREEASDTLRDTTGYRQDAVPENATFIDGYEQEKTTFSAGLDKPFPGQLFGADLSGALLYEHHIVTRKWPDFSKTQKSEFHANVITGTSRMTWKTQAQKTIFAFGALADFDGHGSPMVSLDVDRNLSAGTPGVAQGQGFRLFGNAAWRGDWHETWNDGELESNILTGSSAKLGLGYSEKRFSLSGHGFGRYYLNPELPTPLAYAHYRELSDADYAWVFGAAAKMEARTLHHFALAINLSSVYGEYSLSDGRSLPWEANSRLDMSTSIRYYPLKDSLFSLILTHHAGWHRPLYYYKIQSSNSTTETLGTREIYDYNEFTDLFRTDIRANLDLPGHLFFFRKVRFYLEADNVFANLDVDALRFLGGDNARERSLVVQDSDKRSSNGYKLVPFMAKGMGLYLQFGVEANFAI
ncbi:MAG: hypothetical protein SPL19_11955 [Fibrobacter sp.]|nr:hypothetical protein [Fibrobacter sp.]MDY6370403.1 hypothetical protein [Fibrobacter sp.]MDY6391062.1 hypothetical protein [Fibrobacter sp.]